MLKEHMTHGIDEKDPAERVGELIYNAHAHNPDKVQGEDPDEEERRVAVQKITEEMYRDIYKNAVKAQESLSCCDPDEAIRVIEQIKDKVENSGYPVDINSDLDYTINEIKNAERMLDSGEFDDTYEEQWESDGWETYSDGSYSDAYREELEGAISLDQIKESLIDANETLIKREKEFLPYMAKIAVANKKARTPKDVLHTLKSSLVLNKKELEQIKPILEKEKDIFSKDNDTATISKKIESLVDKVLNG